MERKELVITPASNLSQYLPQLGPSSPGQVFMYGLDGVHTTAVRFVTHAVLQDIPVLIVDGANAFDPYEVVRVAQRRHFDPEPLLRSIQLARAFTCYQLRELVCRLQSKVKKQRSLVVILGLCTTYFDDDVSHTEAAALFYQTWWKLTQLHDQGVPVLIAQSLSPVNPRRKYFLEDLYKLSDLVLRVELRGRGRRRASPSAAHPRLLPNNPAVTVPELEM